MIYNESLKGNLITLRNITLSDCNDTYLSWLNDKSVNMYLENRFDTHTVDSISRFVEEILASESSYMFAIIANDTNKHIGNIKLGSIHPRYHHGDVGYLIGDKSYWGKGIATEAIKLVVDFAFNKLNLRRVQAGVFEDNIASEKALKKAGFALEGRFRKQISVSPPTTQWQDHLYYGILKEDLF